MSDRKPGADGLIWLAPGDKDVRAMTTPHPYCTEHDQPLDWCAHPAPAACYRSVIGVMVHGPGCRHDDDGTRERDES